MSTIAGCGLESRTPRDRFSKMYAYEPKETNFLSGGGAQAQIPALPNRFSDEQIKFNNSRLLGDKKSSHQQAMLDVMHLYLHLFGANEKTPKKREFYGPTDTLRRLPEGHTLSDFDDRYSECQALKRRLVSDPNRRDTVFHNSGKHNDFWKEFLKHEVEKRPDLFTILSNTDFRNNITGETWDLNKHDPLLASELCLQEDFLVLQKNGGSPVTDDHFVCFPSRWNPKEAPGRSVIQTHMGVPKLAVSSLEQTITTIMNKIEVPMSRFTRLVHPLPYLHQAIDQDLISLPKEAIYTPDNVGDKLLLRLEKQRFCRGDNVTGGNPAFKDLLFFSFSTHMLPLKALEACPPFARVILNLHKGFLDEPINPAKPDDNFLKYRGGTETFIHPLIQYLESFAGMHHPPNLEEEDALKILNSLKIPDAAYEMCPLN